MSAKPAPFGDALTEPFWEAAARHELVIQQCEACGHHQFYPRPFCTVCHGSDVRWVRASGRGTIYTLTRVWHSEDPDNPPPYYNALVELDEGPRLFTTLVDGDFVIGQRVVVGWQERPDAPPLPVFMAEKVK